jgi:hypothetical protein
MANLSQEDYDNRWANGQDNAGLIAPALPRHRPEARTAMSPQDSPPQTQGRPFAVEYYYKARWGFADEFLALFRKNHWPVLQKQVEAGCLVQVTAVTFLQLMECQLATTSGAAPASACAADMSACLPESVGQGSLVTEDLREVSRLSPRGDVARGLNPYPAHYRPAFACSLIPCPPSHRLTLRFAFRGHC